MITHLWMDKMNSDVGSARKLSRMKKGWKLIYQDNIPTNKPLIFEESRKKRCVHVYTEKKEYEYKSVNMLIKYKVKYFK